MMADARLKFDHIHIIGEAPQGTIFSVEPCEFLPGARIAYRQAPDGVTVELVQAKA